MVKERAQSYSNHGERSPYEIQILGEIDQRWSEWFNGIEITRGGTSDHPPLTLLSCPAIDQAKLRGILNKIWDLNLKLLSVRHAPDPKPEEESSDGFVDNK
ncbi:MAG: hypothetical protein GTO14_13140 [Anaerolineales bacterium]|nr:hypothetical protein [Anaerolineales bacterium]